MAQCTATSKQSGERCRRDAIVGGTVCPMHGGMSPQVQRAAKRRLAEARARQRLDEVEVEPIDDPIAAYAQVVAEAVALKDVLASHVAAIEGGLEANATELRATVGAYERAIDRAGRLLGEWVRLGLSEQWIRRQTELDDERVMIMRELIRRAGESLGVGEREWRRAIDEANDRMGLELEGESIVAHWRGETDPEIDAEIDEFLRVRDGRVRAAAIAERDAYWKPMFDELRRRAGVLSGSPALMPAPLLGVPEPPSVEEPLPWEGVVPDGEGDAPASEVVPASEVEVVDRPRRKRPVWSDLPRVAGRK